jgi:hypothetical protein
VSCNNSSKTLLTQCEDKIVLLDIFFLSFFFKYLLIL